ncbi:MAG: HD domain-containing protein [Candidatus Omnitrophota bacterium]
MRLKFPPEYKNILKEVYTFAKSRKVKLTLVGGILRDLLLGREKENPDFDFAIKKGAISFGRNLAKKLKAGYVVLDKEHGACRVVKKNNGKIYTFDFTDFRKATLEKDLLHRDFTINALALEFEKVFSDNAELSLIDPYSGQKDLKGKIIRVVNKKSFCEDPLRVLRAFSFSSIFGFGLDKETLRLAKKEKNKLLGVSFERIRDELFKVFSTESAYGCFLKLDKLGILKIIFPEIKKMRGIGQGPYHHLDVWQHTLETVFQIELLIQETKNNKKIQGFLNETISADRKRRALIKLGAFLHDIGKPAALRHKKGKTIFHGHERIGLRMTEEICKRLKLSNDEVHSLKTVVLWHLRPGFMADIEELTPRAKFRYFRDTGREAISVLLLSVADQRATKGPLTTKASRLRHEKVVFGLIREYFLREKEKKAPRLINGDDLIKKFKLEPSALIGKILSEVEELQAIGKIKTKNEALGVAAKLIGTKR